MRFQRIIVTPLRTLRPIDAKPDLEKSKENHQGTPCECHKGIPCKPLHMSGKILFAPLLLLKPATCARCSILARLSRRLPTSSLLRSSPHRRSVLPFPPTHARRLATMIPIERVADKLEAPALDDRSYRVIRLPNKLEALLVHDPETDKASASVNVNVGSFSDADDMPGMAHAVEHLLFMGTKKVRTLTTLEVPVLTVVSFRKRMLTTSTSLHTRAILTRIPPLRKRTTSSRSQRRRHLALRT